MKAPRYPHTLCGVLLLASSVVASACATSKSGPTEPPADEPSERLDPIEIEKDGTVIVGDQFYENSKIYSRTAEFVRENRRCGSHDTPRVVSAAPTDCAFDSTTIDAEYAPGVTFEIPVVFHIIVDSDGTGFIPVDMINSQVDIINEDFLALQGTNGFGGTNTTVRFVLASVDPDGNPTSGINYIEDKPEYFNDPGTSGPNPMKLDLAWNTSRYFNIYTNDSAGFLGYATFPQQEAGGPEDGVVVAWNAIGRDSSFEPFNQGRTLTHEIGHYLGLFHTFQGGCGSANDYVNGDLLADTVSHPSPNFGCESGVTSCSAGGELPASNYMNYSDDLCMNQFSVEQANRLRCSMINYRSELFRVVDGGSNQLPSASFDSAVTDLSVAFTSTATDVDGDIVAHAWDFGDGATSSAANPSHTYSAPGTFSVTLVVTDNEGATASSVVDVTVTEVVEPGDEAELQNGVAVSGIDAQRHDEKRFFIDVPAGVKNLSFLISGENGDADLYVRKGAEPTQTEWDFRPFLSGSNEVVDVGDAAQDRYHVMVRAFTSFSGVTLTASYTMDNGGGELVINEILADPGEFDTNGDGVVSTQGDEFIELVNVGSADLDLSGATIADRVGTRVTFPAGTSIAPGGMLVVVGDGSVSGVASISGGALYLNNKGDDITIRSANGDVLAMAAYGRSGGNNQSLVRAEEGTNSAFVLHTTMSSAAASPGTKASGAPF